MALPTTESQKKFLKTQNFVMYNKSLHLKYYFFCEQSEHNFDMADNKDS